MKAIILAAGMGTRLGKYTKELPKCMLSFGGKTLIEHQVETLRSAGIKDIIIVKGYMPNKIQIPGVKYYVNEDFANTNMVETLFKAEKEMNDDILVCYSDILYEKKVLDKVLESKADIGVTIDEDYWDYWKARLDHPEQDTESLVVEGDRIVELGDTKCGPEKAKVRYVGLIKFSKKGLESLKKVYHEDRKKYYDKDYPWLRSKSFKKAYMTCMLQALINDGHEVEPITVQRGWLEFDTESDYEKYNNWLKNGLLDKYFKSDSQKVGDMKRKIKIIVTIGPATRREEDLKMIKDKGVSFVRVNMSHSSLEDLEYFIGLAKKVGIPFVIDTEGSQIRSGELKKENVSFEEGQELKIYTKPIKGNAQKICLKPGHIISQLGVGDLLYVDFDTLTLRVSDISTAKKGYITAKVITGGNLGRNKAVIIDPTTKKRFELPPLSEKDYKSIEIGLRENVSHIAASFMRSGKYVEEVRKATKNSMKIISKIECIEGLENLNEIIDESDFLLIDRGDLSKEIPIEKIPFTQKIIINRARKKGKGVFVATNLLETMIEKKKPTRAEVHDVINTILDGAEGLALAAETAIGKHPMECINMINKLINHSELAVDIEKFKDKEDKFVKTLEDANYLLDMSVSSSLIPPHGGKLVDRMLREKPDKKYLGYLKKIKLSESQQMDAEQIAIGTFSPIEGFMIKKDFESVLDNMRLSNGIAWTIPIILDVSEEESKKISVGEDVALLDSKDEPMAILHVEEKYGFDKEEMAKKLYSTNSEEHPGVKLVKNLKPVLLGGKIDLIKRKDSEYKEYELTPKQVRRLFEEKGWTKVVGFHTRNVIHKSHEFIQLKAMEQENCDGLFVHPIVGKKKVGDFNAKYIINSYEKMMKEFYPKNKVVFVTFSTFSRYAGPREAIFTALCRKNFGCSHFIVGRDHTGVGNFYHPTASHDIFDQFPDLGVKPVKFDNVFYSKRLKTHIHEKDSPEHDETDKLHISGTQARQMLEKAEMPPEWFMRPEISSMLVDAIKKGEEVFVKEE